MSFKRIAIFLLSTCVLLLALLMGGAPSASAQAVGTPAPTKPPMSMDNMNMGSALTPLSPSVVAGLPAITRTGHLSVNHGDPQPGTVNAAMAMQTVLINATGQITYLSMDANQAIHLNNQVVTVQGNLAAANSSVNSLKYDALYVSSVSGANTAQAITPQAITGSYPWVSVLCRFSDSTSTTPKDPTYFGSSGLMSSSYPGINHYWMEQSYGQANINGTAYTNWYNLPYPHAHYIQSDGSFDLWNAATDCSNLALNDVTFKNYVGINFIFNGNLDCCAWGGGGASVTQNGQTNYYRTTWMPPWGYETQAVMAHEMGHGFGLLHSRGSSHGGLGSVPYTSDWDVMSGGGRDWHLSNLVNNPNYGDVGSGTIAAYKDELGWIPASRKMIVMPGHSVTITIERLDLPVASNNYLMAQIPIPGGNTYYTVESRMMPGGNGYDNVIPANAVILHTVDYSRTEPAWVVDTNSDGNTNVNDSSAEWTPGKTFTDAANKITVSVLSQGTSSFTVKISNAPVAPAVDSIGIYRNGTFYMSLHNQTGNADLVVPYTYGTTPYPVVGDWTGSGVDTIGVYDQSNGTFHLRNSNTAGTPDENFTLGNPGDMPLSGHWSAGAANMGAGVYRQTNGILYLKNALSTGNADNAMVMGIAGDIGVAGDWTGKGYDSPGVYRPGAITFYLSNAVTSGVVNADLSAVYGSNGDTPIAGDWIAQGHDGIGLFRPTNGFTYLRNTVNTGFADTSFFYGVAGDVAVAGHWQLTYPGVAPAESASKAVTKTLTPVPNNVQGGSVQAGNGIGG